MSATDKTKGAGASFWRLKTGEELDTAVKSDFTEDTKWDQLAAVKDITPGEITVEDYEDTYIDDEEIEWTKTTPGYKTGGDVSATLAWKPGETAQQQLVTDVNDETITYYRIKYPNGAVDVWYGYINSLGKAIPMKETMTRTVKIKSVGKPITGEEIIAMT
jgi:uncharacterized protein YjdB